jgi:hypothetical protein
MASASASSVAVSHACSAVTTFGFARKLLARAPSGFTLIEPIAPVSTSKRSWPKRAARDCAWAESSGRASIATSEPLPAGPSTSS